MKYHLLSISSDIVSDDFEQGEGESTGCGLGGDRIGRVFNSKEDVVAYLEKHYGLSKDPNDYEWSPECLATNRQCADHSEAQNGGWMEPTQAEVKAWKKGKAKLFTEHYSILMRVDPSGELLELAHSIRTWLISPDTSKSALSHWSAKIDAVIKRAEEWKS